MSKKTIAVVGATGAQGGGLARAILADPASAYQARAITRNPASEKARTLSAAGAEVVAADLDDAESLKRAFDGAAAAFCVTNYWEHFSPEKELQQAANLAQAAKDAGVEHVIWSTLEDSRKFIPLEDDRMPTLMGKYKVPHFDAKGEADELFRATGLPTTFLLTSFYWDNFIHFGMGPKKGADGKYAIALPLGGALFPGISVEDIGRCAYGIFQQGLAGKTVGVAGEHLTGDAMAAALSTALGVEVGYHALDPAVYRGFGFPGADDLGNMFQFNRDFAPAFCAARSVEFARSVNPALENFSAWLSRNASRIPLE
ncbi:MAG: NmrA/HSCARG family protein [Bryobacteraceae bacterium]